MYQRVLHSFSKLEKIRLETPLSIIQLALVALSHSSARLDCSLETQQETAENLSKFLISKAPMLREYFAVEIDSDGMLQSLPSLLPNYVPPLAQLPNFVVRLGSEVGQSL